MVRSFLFTKIHTLEIGCSTVSCTKGSFIECHLVVKLGSLRAVQAKDQKVDRNPSNDGLEHGFTIYL
jgi:hypothetical protein